MVFPGMKEAASAETKRETELVRIWVNVTAYFLSQIVQYLYNLQGKNMYATASQVLMPKLPPLSGGCARTFAPSAPLHLDRPLPSLVLHRYFCLGCTVPQGAGPQLLIKNYFTRIQNHLSKISSSCLNQKEVTFYCLLESHWVEMPPFVYSYAMKGLSFQNGFLC